MKSIENQLKGGHPNSLGNTIEVVEEILKQHQLFDELFNCYFSNDDTVRLRVSNAMKRICNVQKSILVPYIDRLLKEVAAIDQASTQWTLAQLFEMLEKEMSASQVEQAKEVMKSNLEKHKDWIVLNETMRTLAKWSEKNTVLKAWLSPHLHRLSTDQRKSVSNRAKKIIAHHYS